MKKGNSKKLTFRFWQDLSGDKKLALIGSILLFISLFLPWYSDVDALSTGDSFTALNGPLYLLGFSIMTLSIANLVFAFGENFFNKRGIYQMAFGFGSMYLLIVINSAYFHPKFGLNLLSKTSEYGVMIAMVATVLVCVGGYLNFSKNEGKNKQKEKNELNYERMKPTSSNIQKNSDQKIVAAQDNSASNAASTVSSERFPDQKNKVYEQMKKMMEKDTMTANQRKADTNPKMNSVYLGNSPTNRFSSGGNSNSENNGSNQPQRFRMDL
ncbi:hypothetical protein GF376_02020 [Candidatus Peregrinibacteria bacterium]|nr:hypothetical protein [Candidatus Peregrinibacteria bacterium]